MNDDQVPGDEGYSQDEFRAMEKSISDSLGGNRIEWRNDDGSLAHAIPARSDCPPAPQPKWKHGKLHLKKRQSSNPDGSRMLPPESPFSDPIDALMPTDFPPEAESWNPFGRPYEMFVPELNITLWVSFRIEGDLDLNATRDPIKFTNDGVSYSFPFFPPENRGKDPGEGYDGEIYNFYREGERRLFMIPEIEKAVSYVPGGESLSLTKEATAEYVTPDRLMDAIYAFKRSVDEDPHAPLGLSVMLDDMCKDGPVSAWDDRDDEWEEDEDEDDYYGEDDDEGEYA